MIHRTRSNNVLKDYTAEHIWGIWVTQSRPQRLPEKVLPFAELTVIYL